MKQRGEYRDAMAFADTDALRALEAITRHRPDLVVLESAFAATSRGTALINRIKADPSLARSEVRIVAYSPDADALRSEEIVPDVTPAAGTPPVTPAPPTIVPPPAPAAPSFPLDNTGTRRAPRHQMPAGTEVLVDGNPATLVDLSIEGAQLISPTTLKPNQRIRLTLPGLTPVRVIGEIAWAMFEMPQTGPRYRVGLAFVDPDVAGIQRFIDGTVK
jgi:hypothetical protein